MLGGKNIQLPSCLRCTVLRKGRLSSQGRQRGCTTTEMIPTVEMIPATEMTLNHHWNDPHHRNDTYSQLKWSRHKFLEPWLKWTWDFAIYSKFFVYSCKHDSKQRKIEKAIRLITVLYTDFVFKILTFFFKELHKSALNREQVYHIMWSRRADYY